MSFRRRLPYYIATACALAFVGGFIGGGIAFAGDLSVETRCDHTRFSTGCRTVLRTMQDPDVLSPEEIAERDARIAKWEKFCAPVAKVDSLGVSRLSYSHAGCEFGRAE